MISLHKGSILDAQTDFIVNPANSFLRHGGGLAKVIDEAARCIPVKVSDPGHADYLRVVADYTDANDTAPLVATGNALATPPGMLPFKGVIHAVGPIWNGGSFYENELLHSAIEAVCEQLPEGASVAIPAISSGVFGMPIAVVARVSIAAACWYPDNDIQFWLFSDEHMDAFKQQTACPVFG